LLTSSALAERANFRVGEVIVSPSTRTIRGPAGSCDVEPRVMQVLVTLADAAGSVVTRETLFRRCWGGVYVGDDSLNRAIAGVRRVASEVADGSFKIETIPRTGYRLIAAPAAAPVPEEAAPSNGSATAAAEPEPATTASRWPGRKVLIVAAATLIPVLAPWAPLVLSRLSPPEASSPAQESLAVLPFRDLSNKQDYFAEGVAEEILGQLAREPELKVAGRTSTRMFGDNSADAREVGRKLQVAYLLEGSVRRGGNKVRVNVALVRAKDGIQLWSDAYDGTLDDILLIQHRIGLAVAGNLRKKLVHSKPPAGSRATSGEVYSAYLTARSLLRARQSAKTAAAIELLREAVKRDPRYAPAWASLGTAMAVHASFAPSAGRNAIRTAAISHARRALELAPDLPEAHTAMAIILGSDVPASAAHIRRAAQLDPNNAEVQLYLGQAHGAAGRFPEQLAAYRRAAELDPMFRSAAGATARIATSMGEERLAAVQIRRLEQGGSRDVLHIRGHLDWARGDFSQAANHFDRAIRQMEPHSSDRMDMHLGELLRVLGYHRQALEVTRFDEGLWRLWQGEVPSIAALRARNRTCAPVPLCGGEANDHDGFYGVVASKLILKARPGRELAALYDHAGLLGLSRQHLDDRPAVLVSNGPVIAMALREAGRAEEASRLLALIDGHIRRIMARGRVPHWFYADAAQSWALQGRRDLALSALERAVQRGWIYGGEMALGDIGEEPAFQGLRGHPRFERVRARIAAHFARERAEIRPLLAELGRAATEVSPGK
jgi:TolB-like protein/DNA-binding winged helix-turn-helix (wHTH) protein/Flp pilus assembly protein TadD